MENFDTVMMYLDSMGEVITNVIFLTLGFVLVIMFIKKMRNYQFEVGGFEINIKYKERIKKTIEFGDVKSIRFVKSLYLSGKPTVKNKQGHVFIQFLLQNNKKLDYHLPRAQARVFYDELKNFTYPVYTSFPGGPKIHDAMKLANFKPKQINPKKGEDRVFTNTRLKIILILVGFVGFIIFKLSSILFN